MKPNIVVVISDQQRADTLGCFHVQKNITPNLDAIGAEGTIFKRCYSVQPVCGPARACLQSGRYASETGNFKNGKTLPKDVNTIAKYAKKMGYQTAYIGKWHLYGDKNPITGRFSYDVPKEYRAGYDYWLASNALEFTSHAYDGYLFDTENCKVPIAGYRADFIADKAVEYLKHVKREKPFFLFVSFLEPHQQNDLGRFTGPKGEAAKFQDFAVPGDLKDMDGDYMEAMPEYLAMCHNLDENVGKIRDMLQSLGCWDNTVFFYSSDHGCHFKTRNGEYKRSCHEASTRVPLVVHGPGFLHGGERDDITTIMDIPASILESLGAELPVNYRGTPLQKLDRKDRDVLIQISEENAGRSIVSGKWKYCVANDAGGLKQSSEPVYYEKYLYNLEEDPCERHNLIESEQYRETRETLKRKLLKLIHDVEKETPEILPITDNPYYHVKYSFLMSLNQLLGDEKSYAVIKKEMPFLIDNKMVQLGANIKFMFLLQYFQKLPFMKKKLERVQKEFDRLNQSCR